MARKRGQPPGEFVSEAKSSFEKEIADEVVKKFILDERPSCNFTDNCFWEYCREESNGDLSVNFEVQLPIIGVGAPAGAFLPPVAERLWGDFIEVESYEVGNAVGAVTGRVTRRIEILVAEKPETEKFLAFFPDDRVMIDVEDEAAAMEEAIKLGRKKARDMVLRSGGKKVALHVRKEPMTHGRGKVKITAIGEPRLEDRGKFD